MRNFITALSQDVRAGQDSWRIYAASSLMGLAAATANVIVRML